jgi:hypothetical protein
MGHIFSRRKVVPTVSYGVTVHQSEMETVSSKAPPIEKKILPSSSPPPPSSPTPSSTDTHIQTAFSSQPDHPIMQYIHANYVSELRSRLGDKSQCCSTERATIIFTFELKPNISSATIPTNMNVIIRERPTDGSSPSHTCCVCKSDYDYI